MQRIRIVSSCNDGLPHFIVTRVQIGQGENYFLNGLIFVYLPPSALYPTWFITLLATCILNNPSLSFGPESE